MSYDFLISEREGRVAKITLNRPEKLNALSSPLRVEILAALREADKDDNVRSIVITGAGRAFSAGADLSGGGEGGGAPRDAYQTLLGQYEAQAEGHLEWIRGIRRLTKPVVAAVNGYALGAGFELVMTFDMLIASEQAVFGAPEIRHGSIVATWLPYVIGPMWSKRIILTGDHVSAQKAKEIGLVLDVVPHEQLMETAMGLAQRIAMVPPLAVRLNKRMLDGVIEMMGVEQATGYGELVSAICHSLIPLAETADGRNLRDVRAASGLRGFLEARDGPFGRNPL